jgi:hypothetical protein
MADAGKNLKSFCEIKVAITPVVAREPLQSIDYLPIGMANFWALVAVALPAICQLRLPNLA